MKTVIFSPNNNSYLANRLSELAPNYFDIEVISAEKWNAFDGNNQSVKNIFFESESAFEALLDLDFNSFFTLNTYSSILKSTNHLTKTKKFKQIKNVNTLKNFLIGS
ncbi:MAG: hypothetical protein PHV68_05715 [Candidatus Gastranaerophilales bacterium]|nr:hypothetical protein [Candidatus Gastranaerophilales bacterium]